MTWGEFSFLVAGFELALDVMPLHWLLAPTLPTDPPKETGGSDVTEYVVELFEGLSGKFQWDF